MEVRSKKVKNCLKYIFIINTFSNFLRDFRLMVKEAIVVVDKTQKRMFMCVFYAWIAILSFIFGRPLNLAQDV